MARTGYRRTVGNHRTASTSRAAQTPRRKTTHRGPGGSDGYRLRAKERHPLGDASQGDGLRIGDDLLATLARVARGRGVGKAAPHLARPPGGGRPDRLGACLARFGFHPGQKGGAKTGANPTDKGKAGSKRHLVSDRGGIPLAVIVGPRGAGAVHGGVSEHGRFILPFTARPGVIWW